MELVEKMGMHFDTALNHKAGADYTERCRVVEVDGNSEPSTFLLLTKSRFDPG